MATRYSDYITIRESKPAYNIGREEKGEWETFIPNDQFNEILRRVITAVRNNDQDAHKSFWMDGTYGAGKSHAAAVIKHLLCDKVEEISEYVKTEYAEPKFDILRQSIFDLRQNKRLFPVNLYGTEGIAHKEDFSHQLQSAIKRALKSAGITNFFVKTDFDDYAEHVESEPQYWTDIIERSPKLQAYAPTVNELANKLRAADSSLLTLVKLSLKERRMDIRLDSANISDWFFEVQDLLVDKTDYNGFLIIWDEFTDMMKSDIGPSLLVELQKLTERAMETCNNSYFFFISHPSALNKLDAQERTKTTGRYHYMKYNMETVSAFKIMSRKFKIVNGDVEGYNQLTSRFFDNNPDILSRYIVDSNDKVDTANDLRNLYPIHPATANLATYYARVVGSSSRSVFEFIGANQAVRDFLEDENRFKNQETITADYLWDYVLDVFNEDHIRYGAVTERFNSYRLQVQNNGEDSFSVFKGILLLNALNNVANSDNVTPSEENIRGLFVGTPIELRVDMILQWLNENSIIQRTPGGLYSIQFSALPPKEIEEIKAEMKEQFEYTSKILNYGQEATKAFNTQTANVSRPINYHFYSLLLNEHLLQNQIIRDKDDAHGYELFLAMMLGRNDNELNDLRAFAKTASRDERFRNVVFLVFDTVFGDDEYNRFIEYMANAQCAAKHNLPQQQAAHVKNAQEMIGEWMKAVRRGNFTYFVHDIQDTFSTMKLVYTINNNISPYVFECGPESLDVIRARAPKTFWKNQLAKETSKTFLLYDTLDEVLAKASGPALPLKYLLQDAVDDNLNWKPDVDQHHPLYLVWDYVQRKIKNADKTREFNLADKFQDLTQPPYGLYPSYAGVGMLAYAMRQCINKIYSQDGKPRLQQHLAEDVIEVFKVWETGRSGNKVSFMFETKEAGLLSKHLIKDFKLKNLKGYSDISSLKDARWAITHEYTNIKGYPLWTLKYAKNCSVDLQELIDMLVTVVHDPNINKNPSFMAEVITKLSSYEIEFMLLLNQNGVFEEGYHNFLKSNEFVKLSDAQLEDAKTYIKQHLQGEIGLWRENEVTEKLKDWKLSLVPTEPLIISQTPITPIVPHSNSGSSTVSIQKQEVVDKINRMQTLDRAKLVLSKLCEMGYYEVINGILKE